MLADEVDTARREGHAGRLGPKSPRTCPALVHRFSASSDSALLHYTLPIHHERPTHPARSARASPPLPTAAARADTYPRQPGIDALHYVFRLRLTDASNEIAGDATATLRMTASGVKEVYTPSASAANGTGMSVSAVTVAGRLVQFEHTSNRLRIGLGEVTAVSGSEVEIAVTYRGIPAAGLGLETTSTASAPRSARTGRTTRGSGCR